MGLLVSEDSRCASAVPASGFERGLSQRPKRPTPLHTILLFLPSYDEMRGARVERRNGYSNGE